MFKSRPGTNKKLQRVLGMFMIMNGIVLAMTVKVKMTKMVSAIY